MRVLMTSFVVLLALIAFGPGVTGTALGDDTGQRPGKASEPRVWPEPQHYRRRLCRLPPTLAPAPPPAPTDISSSTSAGPRADICSSTRTQSYTGGTDSG